MYKFEELVNTGTLWMINRSLFHPMGYALTVHVDENGRAIGWEIQGDGKEPWMYITKEIASHFNQEALNVVDEAEKFKAFKKLLGD